MYLTARIVFPASRVRRMGERIMGEREGESEGRDY